MSKPNILVLVCFFVVLVAVILLFLLLYVWFCQPCAVSYASWHVDHLYCTINKNKKKKKLLQAHFKTHDKDQQKNMCGGFRHCVTEFHTDNNRQICIYYFISPK